jgi:arabinofuranosyltransferase
VLLYLGYIVKIGGDFMSGRFLTAPLLLCVAIISNQIAEKRIQLVVLGIVSLVGLFSLRSPILSSNMLLYLPNYPISDRNGIVDERLYYFGNSATNHFDSFIENGFREASLGSEFAGKNWHFVGFRKVIILAAVGQPGYEKGPNFYVIDFFALTDPLLARLTVRNKDWRIGHFDRDLPDGYFETLETGKNKIVNPDLASYYSKLSILTQGRLRSWDRIVEIWKFNTGQYDYLLEKYERSQ